MPNAKILQSGQKGLPFRIFAYLFLLKKNLSVNSGTAFSQKAPSVFFVTFLL